MNVVGGKLRGLLEGAMDREGNSGLIPARPTSLRQELCK